MSGAHYGQGGGPSPVKTYWMRKVKGGTCSDCLTGTPHGSGPACHQYERIEHAPSWRCETCKWWETTKEGYSRGECKRVKSDDHESGHPADPAMVLSCDGCHQELMTKPDFGCVLWESKP
jgi:hypothetical protein